MKPLRTALLLALLVVPTACGGRLRSGGVTTTPTTAPTSVETTSVPDTTVPETSAAPQTTAAETTVVPDTSAPAAVPTEGAFDGSLMTADGRTRTYHAYAPSDLDPAGVPLLVALHGGTGSGLQFETSSGFDDLAELYGFVVVYPDGIGAGANETDNRTWNAGICCGQAALKGVDDVAFVRQLIDAMEAEFTIDPTSVFAAGHSNGGFMAFRLACELSDRIAAVGLQAGGLGVGQCNPSRPVSLLHIHGTADTNVPVAGGKGSGISQVSFPPLDQSLATVTAAMGCTGRPEQTKDGIVTTRSWDECDGDTSVELQLVDGATHTWITGSAFDSSDAIVEFLMAHARS
jgi:polyhydroxybutyrate depolymerase